MTEDLFDAADAERVRSVQVGALDVVRGLPVILWVQLLVHIIFPVGPFHRACWFNTEMGTKDGCINRLRRFDQVPNLKMVPSPKIKSVGRQVDAVSHLELLPLKAGQSKQSLGVAIFIQRFKHLRFFLFSLFSGPNTADAEPEGANSHQEDDKDTVGEALDRMLT